MSKEYRIEKDLIKGTRPKNGSKRYKKLEDICWEKGLWPAVWCERCQRMLINPQSILIHQGSVCQSKMVSNG